MFILEMVKRFQKVLEDFICDNCGQAVSGDGFTNHCPECLYSKHVDLETPGDRQSDCKGRMKPIGLKLVGGQPDKIVFRCERCRIEKFNKVSSSDNFEELLKLPVL